MHEASFSECRNPGDIKLRTGIAFEPVENLPPKRHFLDTGFRQYDERDKSYSKT